MKKTFLLTAISTLFLLNSCSNEDMGDITPEVKTYSPTANAVIGEFTDAKAGVTTKAGVVEDNLNYADGEKFYWHNGDKAKVLFFPDGDLNAIPVELTYTATVAEGAKPNTCQFSTTGSVPAGNYAVYALYPANRWDKDETGYKATFPNYGILNFVIFEKASSEHLKDYMFMKADAGNVTISGEGGNSLNFSFKHLTSVVRFHITSDYETTLLTAKSLRLFEKSNSDFFNTAVYLNSINGMATTAIAGSQTYEAEVYPMNDLPYVKKGSTWEFDYYMPVFPTTVSTTGMKLSIKSNISWKEDNTNYTQSENFDTYNGLSFDNELSFMPNGFEAGKSYYFDLKADI